MLLPQFQRQADKPLFPDIFWNRPTMRGRAGRLLVVGGHKNQFDQVQTAYEAAEAAGIGECLAVVPDSLRRLIGETGYIHFVPSSQSGSLGKAALGEISHLAADSDAIIIGHNLTNNAETAIMIESLTSEVGQKIIYTEEAVEILKFRPDLITGNSNALVAVTMNGLFSLANHHHMPIAIKPEKGVVGKIEILQQLVSISRCSYLVFDREIMVASDGKMSLTPLEKTLSQYPAAVTGLSATFWLQHPGKSFQALTTAAYILATASRQDPRTSVKLTADIKTAVRGFEV